MLMSQVSKFCLNKSIITKIFSFFFSGFDGDGFSCEDIDECLIPTICGKNQRCENIAGGYECPCLPGFDGTNCTDIDECTSKTHFCDINASCINTEGSYDCNCNNGYRKNETDSCENIDECKDSTHECLENELCVDHMGDYACKCIKGLTADGLECEEKYKNIPDLLRKVRKIMVEKIMETKMILSRKKGWTSHIREATYVRLRRKGHRLFSQEGIFIMLK